jgi:hypothetical protein
MHLRIPTLLVAAVVVAAGLPGRAVAQDGVLKNSERPSAVRINCTSTQDSAVHALAVANDRVNLIDHENRTVTGACLSAMLTTWLLTTEQKSRPLQITGAHVTGEFRVDFIEVNFPVILEETTFDGQVILENSRFKWDVALNGSTFTGPVHLNGSTFDADLFVRSAVFEARLNAYHTRVGGNLEAMRTEFRDSVDFRGLSVGGETRLDHVTAGFFNASRASFNGDVVLTGAKFTGAGARLDLERTVIRQSLFLNSLHPGAPVMNLVYAEIGYNFDGRGTEWGDTVNLRGMQTGMHADLRDGRFRGPLILEAAQVGGDLKLQSVEAMQGALMTRAQVKGTLSVQGAGFSHGLSLAEVSAGVLNVTGLRALPPAAAFSVDGLTFGHIEHMVNGKSSPDSLLALFAKAEFSADAYGTLESFFARHGDKRSANRTLFARRARERDGLPIRSQLGSHLLNWTVRYGRWPALAFVWWAGFVALGTYVFTRARITLVDPAKANCQRFDPVWYSLDTFLPMVDLKYADDWKLTREADPRAWLYLRFHTLAGWVLIPVALAAISGLLK